MRAPLRWLIVATLVLLFARVGLQEQRLPVASPASAVGAVEVESAAFRLVDAGRVDRMYAAYHAGGRLYGVEDHFIYVSDDGGATFRQLGKLPKVEPSPAGRLKDLIARSSLVRYIRRNPGPANVVQLASGTILVFYDHIYRSSDGGRTFSAVDFPKGELVGPFAHGIAVDARDRIYFGQYTTGSRPHEVRIFRGTDDGQTWEVAYTFPRGAVFHVHSIHYDRYRDRLWVATGDTGDEPGLFYTDDDFATLDTLGFGTQDWRIVSLIVTEDHLYWGSDNDTTGASIFRWDFARSRLDTLQFIGTPSYYATRLRDGTLAVATAYEPRSPYTRAASPAPEATVWLSQDGTSWHRALVFQQEEPAQPDADIRAQVPFPSGPDALDFLTFTPRFVREGDFALHRYRVVWQDE